MRRMTLWAFGAAVLVGGWVALFEREERDPEEGEPVFDIGAGEIASLTLERPGEPAVRVVRAADGFSVAAGNEGPAPADPSEVDLLFQNAASLRFEREIPRATGDLSAFGLDPPDLVVRIETGSGFRTAGFGGETPASGRRYLQSGEAVLVVPAFARDNFARTAWDLRDKRIFRFEHPAARGLRLTAGGETVEIEREEGRWRIRRPFAFAADPYAASGLVSRLLDAEMLGLADPGDQGYPFAGEGLGAELDLAVGPEERPESRTVRFGAPSSDPLGVFARVEGEPLVFVVESSLRDELEAAVTNGLEGLRSFRLFRFAAFRAVSLDISGPDGDFAFRRRDAESGREWTLGARDGEAVILDLTAVEDLLYGLTSLDADGVGGEDLPPTGAVWRFHIREESEATGELEEPETVRVAVARTGEAWVLREGDARVLALAAGRWEAMTGLIEAARAAPEP